MDFDLMLQKRITEIGGTGAGGIGAAEKHRVLMERGTREAATAVATAVVTLGLLGRAVAPGLH